MKSTECAPGGGGSGGGTGGGATGSGLLTLPDTHAADVLDPLCRMCLSSQRWLASGSELVKVQQ